MSDSIREQIISALVSRLTTAYSAADVYRNPEAADIDTENDADMIGIHEDEPEAAEAQRYDADSITMILRLRHLSKFPKPDYNEKNGTKKAQHGEFLLAELRKNMTSGDRTLGGLCQTIRYNSGEILFPEQYSEFVFVDALFTVEYETDIGDPYNLTV